MSENSRSVREVKLNLPIDLYNELEKLAIEEGYSSVSEYIMMIIASFIATSKKTLPEDLSRLKARIERYVQDEVNKRLAVIDTLRSQVAELYEKLDVFEQKLNELESTIQKQKIESPSEETKEIPRVKKTYKTGIERLREEKIVFESKLPRKIQRDRLFAYFEREGAIVLKLTKERIAIDPDFWREFKYKLLNELTTNVEDEIKNILGDKEFELWKALYSDNAIIYDPRARRWKFILDKVP